MSSATTRILRPYFCNVHAPGGIQVTRNHPPVAGQDATDHDTMHPGLWLAFGDINGQDFWRNKGRIEHVRFTEPPKVEEWAAHLRHGEPPARHRRQAGLLADQSLHAPSH